jgi:hypothetical protein
MPTSIKRESILDHPIFCSQNSLLDKVSVPASGSPDFSQNRLKTYGPKDKSEICGSIKVVFSFWELVEVGKIGVLTAICYRRNRQNNQVTLENMQKVL